MNYRRKIVSFVISLAAIMITLCGFAHAELVGVDPQYPVMLYNSQGVLAYDASSGLLSIDATTYNFTVSETQILPIFPSTTNGSRAVTIRVNVDGAGNVISGNLVVEGAIDMDFPPPGGVNEYDDILLTGDILEFGYLDSGATNDHFDLKFAVTGGSLATDYYIGMNIGVTVLSEGSDFANDFSVDFGGGAKGNIGPLESDCVLEVSKTACIVLPDDGNDCQGKVIRMTLEYTGENCSAGDHSQATSGWRRVRCCGDPAYADPVTVKVTSKRGKHRKKRRNRGCGDIIYAYSENISIGDQIVVEAATGGSQYLKPRVKVRILNTNGDVLQSIGFDTSCRQPLNIGDQFGSMRLVALTSSEGGTVDDVEEECITELPYFDPPHCEGNVEVLKLRYNGVGCAETNHTQDSAKVICSGDAQDASPVRIIAKTCADCAGDCGCGSTVLLDTGSPASVQLDEVIEIVGAPTLTANTIIQIYDAGDNLIEKVCFNTSCSQPLNLGDQFGSLQVFGMTTTIGGSVSQCAAVEYTYTVTNNSGNIVTNVTVMDDKLGEVPGSPIAEILPADTVSLTKTTILCEETSNTVTATSGEGCEGAASAIITVGEPDPPPSECTTKVQAMLLRYTGPDIANATVVIKADKFPCHPVVYCGVNLTTGMVLKKPSENGWTIDATVHNWCNWWSRHKQTDLGAKTKICIITPNSSGCYDWECDEIHTSCSTPFVRQAPAPLNDPLGDPSSNWFVEEFSQK